MKPAIMFHHFHDSLHPRGQGSLSAEQLYDFIKEHDNIISGDEWYYLYQKGQLKTETCITLDDNLKCQFDIALPVLESLNLTAFWFLYTSPLSGKKEKIELYRYFRSVFFGNIEDFYIKFEAQILNFDFAEEVNYQIGNANFKDHLSDWPFYSLGDKRFRYIRDIILGMEKYDLIMENMISSYTGQQLADNLWMSKSEIKCLYDRGHYIGLHSHTHPTRLEKLSNENIKEEYVTNYTLLKELIGDNIFSMSHPCNAYNEYTKDVLRELNISIGFRSNNALSTFSPLELPRIDHTLI